MSTERETINLATLEPAQLAQVKKQLDDELEHLTSSYAQLHGAQSRFRDCLRCCAPPAASSPSSPSSSSSHDDVLVPLTNSLYVHATRTARDRVLVDVGTGFLVEKSLKSAEKYYDAKVQDLTTNLKELEAVVQRKQSNVMAVEEVLRQKLVAAQASQS